MRGTRLKLMPAAIARRHLRLPVNYAAEHSMKSRLEQDVRAAFERAATGVTQPDELVSAVRNLVRDLKRGELPPEKVIVTVKQACGLPLVTIAADTDASTDGTYVRQISDIMLRAVIDEYYFVATTTTN